MTMTIRYAGPYFWALYVDGKLRSLHTTRERALVAAHRAHEATL